MHLDLGVRFESNSVPFRSMGGVNARVTETRSPLVTGMKPENLR